jgi:hypothetical protein
MNELSLLDTDTRNKIRTLWLSGKNILEIQAELNISAGTWDNYYYLDKQGFRSYILEVKRQYMLQEAERVSAEILSIKDAKNNAKLLSIMQKEAEFLRETQGKDQGYSKRIETIGFNVNKNEPLDEEQKERLDKLIKKSGTRTANYTIVNEDSQEPQESPIDITTQTEGEVKTDSGE